MSKKEEKKSVLAEVSNIKKELMMLRIKASSGDNTALTSYRKKRKEIARILTKINDKK